MEETEIPGLISDQQTFFCGNVSGDAILQVTTGSVRLFSATTKEKIRYVIVAIQYSSTYHKLIRQ